MQATNDDDDETEEVVVPKATYNFDFNNIENPFATRAKTVLDEGQPQVAGTDPSLEPEDEDEESR